MKFTRLVVVLAIGIFLLSISGLLYARNNPVTTREGIASDKQAAQEDNAEKKDSEQNTKVDEATLRNDIVSAKQAGDFKKVETLKAQLKAAHVGNSSEKQDDDKDSKGAKKESKEEEDE